MGSDLKKKIPAVTLYFNKAEQAAADDNKKEYLANVEAMHWLLQRYRYPTLKEKERSLYMGTVLCALPELPSKEWLTVSELTKETGVSAVVQKKLRDAKKLPFHNWGGNSIRYRVSEIKEFFEKGGWQWIAQIQN